MGKTFSTLVEGLDLPLWRDTPADSWLRKHGRTRVLLIDDQWCGREEFLGVAKDAPLTRGEQLLHDWLNVDIQYFPTPPDYMSGATPSGTFSDEWFAEAFDQVRIDARPCAAILLDLLFGDEVEQTASGYRFLSIIRKLDQDVPVLILSNIEERESVLRRLKREEASFQDYIPKHDPDHPEQSLLERLAHKLIWWGDLSDPTISAFSAPMRRVSRSMRQIVLSDVRIPYEEQEAGDLAKPVHLVGGYGSGKNFLAQKLESMSRRHGNSFETVTFSGMNDEAALVAIFGSGMFTGATETHWVDPASGEIIGRKRAGERRPPRVPRDALQLATIGTLHRVHLKGVQAGGAAHSGSILLDELGTKSVTTQRLLLGVFNRGRFAPQFIGQEIPTSQALDVWFLITSTPEDYARMTGDMSRRLAAGYTIRIPSLPQRREDVLPIALRVLSDEAAEPSTVFTEGAVQWMLESSAHWRVSDLIVGLRQVAGVTAKAPYSAGDLKSAFVGDYSVREGRSSAVLDSQETPPLTDQPDSQGLDFLELIHTLSNPGSLRFPSGQGAQQELRGKLDTACQAASAIILGYLQNAASHAQGADDPLRITKLYKFASGGSGKTDANSARTNLSALFFSKDAMHEAIKRSKRIMEVVVDLSKRQKQIKKVLSELAKDDPDVRERLLEMGLAIEDENRT